MKNKSLTSITEPLFIPISVNDTFSPASRIISLPKSHSEGLLLKVNLDTEAIDGKASPLKPKVFIEYISSTVFILDVACGKKAFSISKLWTPEPSSMTLISAIPPSSISIVIFLEPASIEFSTSSLTTEEGRSTTSPAAILLEYVHLIG